MLSFTKRMDEGKQAAMDRRNRGLPSAPAGARFQYRPLRLDVDAGSWEWLCREARRDWRQITRQAQNDFAAACLNPLNDQPHTWEFH